LGSFASWRSPRLCGIASASVPIHVPMDFTTRPRLRNGRLTLRPDGTPFSFQGQPPTTPRRGSCPRPWIATSSEHGLCRTRLCYSRRHRCSRGCDKPFKGAFQAGMTLSYSDRRNGSSTLTTPRIRRSGLGDSLRPRETILEGARMGICAGQHTAGPDAEMEFLLQAVDDAGRSRSASSGRFWSGWRRTTRMERVRKRRDAAGAGGEHKCPGD